MNVKVCPICKTDKYIKKPQGEILCVNGHLTKPEEKNEVSCIKNDLKTQLVIEVNKSQQEKRQNLIKENHQLRFALERIDKYAREKDVIPQRVLGVIAGVARTALRRNYE